MYNIPANIGIPSTVPNANDLNKSSIKVFTVVLLNPNFSSITNVEYIEKGKEIMEFAAINTPIKTIPFIMLLSDTWFIILLRNGNPPQNQNTSITAKLKIVET